MLEFNKFMSFTTWFIVMLPIYAIWLGLKEKEIRSLKIAFAFCVIHLFIYLYSEYILPWDEIIPGKPGLARLAAFTVVPVIYILTILISFVLYKISYFVKQRV